MLQAIRIVLAGASLVWLAAWGAAGAVVGISWLWLAAYAAALALLCVMAWFGLRLHAYRGDFAFGAGTLALALAFATYGLLPVVGGGLGVMLAILLPHRRARSDAAATT